MSTTRHESTTPAARRSRLHTALLSAVLVLQLVTAGAALYVATTVAQLRTMAEDLRSQVESSLASVDEVSQGAQERLDELDSAVGRLRDAIPFL